MLSWSIHFSVGLKGRHSHGKQINNKNIRSCALCCERNMLDNVRVLGATFDGVVRESLSRKLALKLCLNERRSRMCADLGDDRLGRNQQCKGPVTGLNLVIQESEGKASMMEPGALGKEQIGDSEPWKPGKEVCVSF